MKLCAQSLFPQWFLVAFFTNGQPAIVACPMTVIGTEVSEHRYRQSFTVLHTRQHQHWGPISFSTHVLVRFPFPPRGSISRSREGKITSGVTVTEVGQASIRVLATAWVYLQTAGSFIRQFWVFRKPIFIFVPRVELHNKQLLLVSWE